MTYSSAVEPIFSAHPDAFDVVEIEPQTVWTVTGTDAEPYRVSASVLDHLDALPGRKLIHSVGVPVGGTTDPDPHQCRLLARMIKHFNSPWASDHLSFNETPEHHTGFFLPPRQTPAGVHSAVASIRTVASHLPAPLAVETGVNYLQPRTDEMDDGAFVAAVVEKAECGLVLDLHNIFANGLNGRQSIEAYLDQLPLDRVWEIHLAGGMEMDGFWLDAHAGPIPDPLYETATRLLPALPNVGALLFEIFPAFVNNVGADVIMAQIERLHTLWALRGTARGDGWVSDAETSPSSSPHSPNASSPSADSAPPCASVPSTEAQNSPPARRAPVNTDASVQAWERALGGLVTRRSAPDAADSSTTESGPASTEQLREELANDNGVAIIARLVDEFRASMIVSVLRLTSRYLMLSLGPDSFRTILRAYWADTPPEQFAAREAQNFADFLEQLNLPLPWMAELLAFERAVLATLIDDETRVVSFAANPLPLLQGLSAGRLEGIERTAGEFEIEVTPDGPIRASGLRLEDVQQAFPYH